MSQESNLPEAQQPVASLEPQTAETPSPAPEADSQRQRVLIGSQRNPEAYRPKPAIAVVDPEQLQAENTDSPATEADPVAPAAASFKNEQPRKKDEDRADRNKDHAKKGNDRPQRNQAESEGENDDEEFPDRLSEDGLKSFKNVPLRPAGRIPVPKVKGKMSDDLEEEFSALFEGTEMESLMQNVDAVAAQAVLEPETKLKGKIVSIGNEDVFFDIGSRDQGIVSLRYFKEEPTIGQELDLTVLKHLPAEGLYELSLPLTAADVRDWEQIEEGMILNAKVIKANTGGLECEVNRIRGFIPMSQIAVFRVENAEDFVGQTLVCVVVEANPSRRNLVLSRKVMIEREREELREKLLKELEVGQVREGLVRKIIDAGAFVDLGGVDGFVPIGALSWGRVRHPGDVLSEGTRIKVKITKMDLEANRISLAYRDDADNPWSNIFERFEEKSAARGKVTKIMDFGAFVELMPGVEGLVHISELSHKRVGKTADVVQEGDWVDVFIQSIDPTARRISLSMKQLMPEPEPEYTASSEEGSEDTSGPTGRGKGKGKKAEVESVAVPLKQKQMHKGPLKGGTGSASEGDRFGLKW